MKINLFDCNVMLGERIHFDNVKFKDGSELLKAMDAQGIDKALVFHSLARENFLSEGNERVVEESRNSSRLMPCWVVMPHFSGECPEPSALLKAMNTAGVKAVRIFPVYHKINLYLWIWEALLKELDAARVPLLIDFSNIGWSQETDWEGIHKICTAFPELPVILLRQGQVADRYIFFLLEKHKNLYIETSYYQVNNGISSLVEKFGSDRLIFGSGMPVYDPGCPINALVRSGLKQGDIQKIGGLNLQNLLKGVSYSD